MSIIADFSADNQQTGIDKKKVYPCQGFSKIFMRESISKAGLRPDIAICENLDDLECTSAFIEFVGPSSSSILQISVRRDYCSKAQIDNGGAFVIASAKLKPSNKSKAIKSEVVSHIGKEGIPAFQTSLCVIRDVVHPHGLYVPILHNIMRKYHLETQWIQASASIFAALIDADKQVKFSTTTYMSGPRSNVKTPEVNALKLLSFQRIFPEYIPSRFRIYTEKHNETKGGTRPWQTYKNFRPNTYLSNESIPDSLLPPYPVT